MAQVHEDCGFRDDREASRYYGMCPDCGYPAGRCLCNTPPPDDQEPQRDEGSVDPTIPF